MPDWTERDAWTQAADGCSDDLARLVAELKTAQGLDHRLDLVRQVKELAETLEYALQQVKLHTARLYVPFDVEHIFD